MRFRNKLVKKLSRKKIKHLSVSYVTSNDIENETRAFILLTRKLSLDAFDGVIIEHMTKNKFSSYDFIFRTKNGNIILDVKTVSKNFFAVGEEKIKRWNKIKAYKFLLFLDVETKKTINLKNITEINFTKMRKKVNKSGGVYYDLRSVENADLIKFERLIYSAE